VSSADRVTVRPRAALDQKSSFRSAAHLRSTSLDPLSCGDSPAFPHSRARALSGFRVSHEISLARRASLFPADVETETAL